MAFKLKGGVGGPFRKNYSSAFKHPVSDASEHPHKPRTHDGYESRYESIQARKKDPEAYDKHKVDNTKKKDALFTDVQSVQSALTGAEFAEGPIGTVAGIANAAISGGRGIYHSLRGESEQAKGNYTDAALSVGGIVPVLGNYATALKVGKNTSRALTAGGYYGRARHIDDVPDVVTGGKTSFGNLLSFEVDAGKVATEKATSGFRMKVSSFQKKKKY